MSAKQRSDYRNMVKRIGPWAGVRYLRNKGVSFGDAYELILGVPCRRS